MSYEKAFIQKVKQEMQDALTLEHRRLRSERDFLRQVYDRISGTGRIERSTTDLTVLQMQADLGSLFL